MLKKLGKDGGSLILPYNLLERLHGAGCSDNSARSTEFTKLSVRRAPPLARAMAYSKPSPQSWYDWFWSMFPQPGNIPSAQPEDPVHQGPYFDGNTLLDAPRKEGQDRRNDYPRTGGTMQQAQDELNQLLFKELPVYVGGIILDIAVSALGPPEELVAAKELAASKGLILKVVKKGGTKFLGVFKKGLKAGEELSASIDEAAALVDEINDLRKKKRPDKIDELVAAAKPSQRVTSQ